jgi:hypothetical protein
MEQWASEKSYDERDWLYELHIAARAAQWGADQELEACCEWLKKEVYHFAVGAELRAARRPKPPTRKEQALKSLDGLALPDDAFETIRFALEALPE